MADRVVVSIDAGVADVRMSRTDKLNALDGEMFEALRETGEGLAEDRSLRAVVLSGEGRGFCAGLDVSGLGGARNLFERREGSPANLAQSAAWVWKALPVPVVAAVHGVAFGGGLQIALAADIRFVTPDARLSVMEIKWGLVPDMTLTQTLPHLVGLDVAKELTFSGRIFSGAEAVELGVATHSSDQPREAALELAREISSKSPDAIRAGKRLFEECGDLNVEDALLLEEQLQRSVIGKPNQVESVKANMEKREPSFEDPS